jgi:hypothetical protein
VVGQFAATGEVELVLREAELWNTEEVELVLIEEVRGAVVVELVVIELVVLEEEEPRSPIVEVELVVVEELRAEANCTAGLPPSTRSVARELIVVITTSPVMAVICSCIGSWIWQGTPLVETKKLSG